MVIPLHVILRMSFSKRLITLRKGKGFTQQRMADAIGIHVSQIKRYESNETQPSLEVLRKISIALNVSADLLLFDKDERGPDDELRFQFEAISRFDPEDKMVAREVLEGLIIKYEAKRWTKVG